MSIMIDTPEGIYMFGLLQIKYRLKIEIDTGMKFSSRPTTLQHVNRIMGTNYRRKADALVEYTARLDALIKPQQETDMAETTEVKYPEVTVQLTGEDGNAFAIMGAVRKALKRAGVSEEELDEYSEESTQGDYDHLLQTAMRWVNVE